MSNFPFMNKVVCTSNIMSLTKHYTSMWWKYLEDMEAILTQKMVLVRKTTTTADGKHSWLLRKCFRRTFHFQIMYRQINHIAEVQTMGCFSRFYVYIPSYTDDLILIHYFLDILKHSFLIPRLNINGSKLMLIRSIALSNSNQ